MARVGVPVPLVDATLAALPGLEVGIGLILVAGFISRPALWVAIALYLGFTAFLVVVWLNAGKDATCGCFGSFLGVWAEAGMVPAIVRNGLAVAGLAAALLVLRRQPRKGIVPHAVPCVPSA